jgi:hypothetical protein
MRTDLPVVGSDRIRRFCGIFFKLAAAEAQKYRAWLTLFTLFTINRLTENFLQKVVRRLQFNLTIKINGVITVHLHDGFAKSRWLDVTYRISCKGNMTYIERVLAVIDELVHTSTVASRVTLVFRVHGRIEHLNGVRLTGALTRV